MRKLLLTAAVVVAAVSGAAAEDDVYPYRESGPERDLFIQSSIKTCVNHNMWKNMGSESEVKAFCECKALNLAENWTQEDELNWWRASASKEKIPVDLHNKIKQGQVAWVKHFSKLPRVPARSK